MVDATRQLEKVLRRRRVMDMSSLPKKKIGGAGFLKLWSRGWKKTAVSRSKRSRH